MRIMLGTMAILFVSGIIGANALVGAVTHRVRSGRAIAEVAVAVAPLAWPGAGSWVVVAFLAVATPIGLTAIRRTGRCGCGALDATNARVLLARNGALVALCLVGPTLPELRQASDRTSAAILLTVSLGVSAIWASSVRSGWSRRQKLMKERAWY